MDRKRVNGPDASVAPIYKKVEENVEMLNKEKKRLDNRGVEDIRPICKHKILIRSTFNPLTLLSVLKPGLVTQASGSAYIEVGNTKVTCAV